MENSGYFSSDDENVNNESDPVTTSSTTSNVANVSYICIDQFYSVISKYLLT